MFVLDGSFVAHVSFVTGVDTGAGWLPLSGAQMTATPWEMFEDALEATGDKPFHLLETVQSRLLGEATPEALELLAVTRCELARAGCLTLVQASSAVRRAVEAGRPGWPNYYLAEACLAAGDWGGAVAALTSIPATFFDERDLRWRSVRCEEIRAVCYVEQGAWPSAHRAVDRLGAVYAIRGEEDDLAPPRTIVDALLRHLPDGCRDLEVLAQSIDVDAWLGAVVAQQVRNSLS
jgi:hypothetical protein